MKTTRDLTTEELGMLGFQEGTITTFDSNLNLNGDKSTLLAIDFEREGKTLTGVIDGTTKDGLQTAIYSYGEVWGGLVLRPENNARPAKDPEKARQSARTYCAREIESMKAYGDDPYAKEIAEYYEVILKKL